MADDPREVLKAAGVECAEVGEYMAVLETEACPECGQFFFESEQDLDAILALARLVAQYKWQREIQVVGALDYNGAIARLDQLWEDHQS